MNASDTIVDMPEAEPHVKVKMCALVETPHPDCHCLSVNSSTIPKIIQYCMGRFHDCPLYKENQLGQLQE